ncbi:MAG: TetR/AcrR family transcriptional regulator [Nitrospirae bacterium]|nr:MAG: TetR/AcrR family transcriptional regulator [Nitrospirota bacterium]
MYRTQRKRREYEARRRDILEAAERQFSRHGFFKTSMAEIASAAQFALGTVYRFFRSKEEIYISIVEAKSEELAALLDTQIAMARTASEKLATFIRVKLEYADRNRDFFRIYVSEWSGFEWTIKSAFGERIWRLYVRQVEFVAGLIQEGIRRKEFRKVDPMDAAFALQGMLNSTMYVWILQPKPAGSLVEKSDLIRTVFLRGIEKSFS